MDCIALASFTHTHARLQVLSTATGLKTAILRKSQEAISLSFRKILNANELRRDSCERIACGSPKSYAEGGVTLLHRNLHRNGIMFSPKEFWHRISLGAPVECVVGNALRRHAKA